MTSLGTGFASPLAAYLLVAALLFAIGLAGALTRRNAILVLIGIELMLNAANLNFIAFWRYGPHPEALTGLMFAIFSDRKSTRLNSSHSEISRMPSSA